MKASVILQASLVLLFACTTCTALPRRPAASTAPVPLTAEALEGEPLPFAFDLGRERAYHGSDFISVYLVGSEDVLVVKFDLPPQKQSALRVDVQTGAASIVHYSGPGIAQFVLPSGPVVPFPEGYRYSSRTAKSATILCQNPPEAGDFSALPVIIVSLSRVDFGDGALYRLEPVSFVLGAFPP